MTIMGKPCVSVAMLAGIFLVFTSGCGGELQASDDLTVAAEARRVKRATPVLSTTPNPVPNAATSIVIGGSNFPPNSAVWLVTSDLYMPMVNTDANGSFSYTYQHLFFPGAYKYEAWDLNGRSTLLATLVFTVCATAPC